VAKMPLKCMKRKEGIKKQRWQKCHRSARRGKEGIKNNGGKNATEVNEV